MKISDCCSEEMKFNDLVSGACPRCHKSCDVVERCESCGGTGEVIDQKRVNSTTIDVPYKKCLECFGNGVKLCQQ